MGQKGLLLAIMAISLVAASTWVGWRMLNGGSGGGASWEGHGLRFELNVGLEGRLLIVDMTVENVASEPITLVFRTSQIWDVEVKDSGGHVLWRWSSDKVFLQAIQYRELAPGEEMTFQTEWEAPGPGHYVVVGYFMGHIGDLHGLRPPPLSFHVDIS